MSDPAVAAAQRAEEIDPFPELDAAGLGYVKRLLTEAAAREALKPIREQSEALSGYAQSLIEDGSLSESAKGSAILEALGVIAPFLYSTEELER